MPTLFPKNFGWGVSTSAYQIEGGSDERGRSIWDAFCETPGKVWEGHHGRDGVDHFHHLEEDVALLTELGVNNYRLSVAWPRVLPEGTGKPSEAGLAFYDRLIDMLLAANITPFITLYHWDLPLLLHERGGWLERDTAQQFADYASVVVRRLGDRVENFITLNEPQCFVGLGYVRGEHAPGLTLPWAEALRIAHHALLGHGLAVQAIRAATPRPCRIGYAPVAVTKVPRSETPENIEAARRATFAVPEPSWWNSAWWTDPVFLGHYPEDGLAAFGKDTPTFPSGDLDVIRSEIDFLGVNIYHGSYVGIDDANNPVDVRYGVGKPLTAYNWPLMPEALYYGPKFFFERYGKPIWITENGVSCRDWISRDGKVHDPNRIDFMARYLTCLARAVAEGVDVRGYFHWSLLDNFEWAEGYKERFGLYYVDLETMRRVPKDSAAFYRRVIESRGACLDEV